jgi:poly-gamma-glutamate capsule biosynthesis protein CapA/YwtB (metallophosphatase superfamily)
MVRSITLALTGDVMLGRLVNEEIARSGFTRPWGDMLPVLQQADLRLINLECALTSTTERWTGDMFKPFFFRSAPRNVETLKVANIDFACLANNHIGDFGIDGLLETVKTLDDAAISHAGAGANIAAARAPARLDVGDCRVSVVAFAEHPVDWAASSDHPGLNYCDPASGADADFVPVEQALREARTDGDFVVFTIHWGPNMRERPTDAFRQFAHRVIDAGADLFWGHSAHVVQGIELYEGKPILYDTGDFVDDYAVDPDLRNDLSALFLMHIEPPRTTRIDLIPVHIRYFQVNRATGCDRDWFARRMIDLCAEMGTTVRDQHDRLTILPA